MRRGPGTAFVRAKHGAFKGSYRFVAARPGSAVRFRTTVRQQTGYPWAAGRSHPVTVRIR